LRSAPPQMPDAELLAAVPEELARRARALPVQLRGGVLHLRGVPDEDDPAALEMVRMHAGAYDVVVDPHPDTVRHLLAAYAARTVRAAAARAGDADAVRLLAALLDLAVGSDASDLHLVPTADGLRVRQRIDGELHVVTEVVARVAVPLVAATKVRAGLDVAERRLPQDGRFTHRIPDGDVDVRVATMPTRFGERITLRLLPGGPLDLPRAGTQAGTGRSGSPRPGSTLPASTLTGLGLSEGTLAALERAISGTDGLVLVCGPTGSGKTTTLHALLARLASGRRNVMTLEDPIERIVVGTSQTQVDTASGLGFAEGLRNLLRHDPDVLLVGEVRDRATAQLAAEAAHTGHLVLSSIHAIDAPGALVRLHELGVAAPMLADTVRVVVAQRLLAVPCPDCAGTGASTEGSACPACTGAGTRGRGAVAEVLELDAPLRALLRDGRGPGAHHDALCGAITPRLREAALERASSGLARKADALRATPAS